MGPGLLVLVLLLGAATSAAAQDRPDTTTFGSPATRALVARAAARHHQRDAGFRVWCDPAVMCDQIDYKVVGYKDYVERMKNDPKFGSNGYIIPPLSIANG